METKKLLDSWTETGNNIEEFKKIINDISASTTMMIVRKPDLTLLSKSDTSSSEVIPMYILKPGNIWEISKTGRSIKAGSMKRSTFTDAKLDDLLKEYEEQTHLMLQHNGACYFTSTNLSPTLGLRVDMGGNSMLEPSLERDILIASRLGDPSNEAIDDEMALIIRKGPMVRKVFAALSKKYAYVPQSFMCDILDKINTDGVLGVMDCNKWEINHQYGEIYVEFPEKADELTTIYDIDEKLVPGLYLSKSDVGECSITVRATWRVGNSIILLDEMHRKHSGKIDMDKLMDDIDKIVFSKYTKLPEKLCELMTIDVTDPTWKKTLSASKFESANRKAVQAMIKSIFKQIKLVDNTTKKVEKELYEALCDELDYSMSYTAYDIAMIIMQLPSRTILNMQKAYEAPLAKACGQAAFCKFEKTKEAKIKLAV